jgi:hypothetical protein
LTLRHASLRSFVGGTASRHLFRPERPDSGTFVVAPLTLL